MHVKPDSSVKSWSSHSEDGAGEPVEDKKSFLRALVSERAFGSWSVSTRTSTGASTSDATASENSGKEWWEAKVVDAFGGFNVFAEAGGMNSASPEALAAIGMSRQVMADRLKMECTMMEVLPRVFLFLVCFTLFLVTQQVEHDPAVFSDIHARLRSHYELEDLTNVRQIPDIVEYLETFVQKSGQLNPLDIYHWCPDNDTIALPLNRIRCKRHPPVQDRNYDLHYGLSIEEIEESMQREEMLSLVNKIQAKINDTSAKDSNGKKRRLEEDLQRDASGAASRGPASSRRSADSLRAVAAAAVAARGEVRRPVAPNEPRMQHLEVALPAPSLASQAARVAKANGSRPMPLARTAGVVGLAANGVLIIGRHHDRGREQPTAWDFDDCGGHGDQSGRYHYHFPPSCLVRARGGVAPSHSGWWAEEEPDTFWPLRGPPSPVLGYALDGVPIFGPYDASGRLVQRGELDECNGLVGLVPGGDAKVYHYVWTVTYPFVPPCFFGIPAKVNLSRPLGEYCRKDLFSATFVGAGGKTNLRPPTGQAAPSAGGAGNTWMVQANGCPDHRYYAGSVKKDKVDPAMDPPKSEPRKMMSQPGSSPGPGSLPGANATRRLCTAGSCRTGSSSSNCSSSSRHRRGCPTLLQECLRFGLVRPLRDRLQSSEGLIGGFSFERMRSDCQKAICRLFGVW
mmetsp:Transcript_104629/g.337257  ORF Transcript_104629/g.337257 Transcript_104629/m.337257 type:complete len:682 (+) Transcript_104629:105-2150(+)